MKGLMNRIVLLILVLAVTGLAKTKNEEFRATWVITWEWMSAGSSVETNKAITRAILDRHKAANMNAVLWQIRQGGTAYYPSPYEPWGSYTGYSDPGYDPIAYAIEEAHKRGMEFHAWFNTFHCSDTREGTPTAEHPEWVCRDNADNPMTSSRCLSPGLKEVRDYTIMVAMDFVRNYDVDGFHLDYVRWNEYTTSGLMKTANRPLSKEEMLDGFISQENLEALLKPNASRYLYDYQHKYSDGIPDSADGVKFSSWANWWRWSTDEFIRTLQDSIKTAKPWVRLSAAALGRYNSGSWNGYTSVYQDAAKWFNEGWVDQLVPMHYHWTNASGFENMLYKDGSASWQPYLTEGIAAGRMYSVGPGSYILDENKCWANHASIIPACRKVEWVDGFQFFSYGTWQTYRYWNEAGATFFGYKTKIRTNPRAGTNPPPAAPTLAVQKIDSLKYQITVTPSLPSLAAQSRNTDNQWYVIYRSTGSEVSPDSSEVVQTYFGTGALTIIDSFSGNQDYNGTYTYGATLADRYWNESALSNTAAGETLPSAAPMITTCNHKTGDTITVIDSVVLTFSKTMDAQTVESAVKIEPAVSGYTLKWTKENTTYSPWGNPRLIIKFNEHLNFATAYTFTLEATAADINGVTLDGNNDGTPGDAFQIVLQTETQDITGPSVIYTYPSVDVTVQDFDVDNVINILFSEKLDAATITAASLYMKHQDQPDSIDFKHSATLDNRSVISVKSWLPLKPLTEYQLDLTNAITDSFGNPMISGLTIPFKTGEMIYQDTLMLDNFGSGSVWEDPDFSGSTEGTIKTETIFDYDSKFYLVGTGKKPVDRKCGYIKYTWDETATEYLLREYLSGGTLKTTKVDTSYTIQCYVYGDGS
nr:family 10 glycosylhydrolase [Candidatus Delongbacteria bacterium]